MSKSSAVIGAVSVAIALSSIGYGVYASRRSEARIAALEARLAETVGGKTKLLTDANLSSDEITTLTDLAKAATDGVTQTITLCTSIEKVYNEDGFYSLKFTTSNVEIKKGLIIKITTAGTYTT